MQKLDLTTRTVDKRYLKIINDFNCFCQTNKFPDKGMATTAFAYGRLLQNELIDGIENHFLPYLFNSFKIRKYDYSLFSGWSYLGYVIHANEYFLSKTFLEKTLKQVNDNIVWYLNRQEKGFNDLCRLNLVNGDIGTGIYLLKEWNRNRDQEIYNKIRLIYFKCKEYLKEVLDYYRLHTLGGKAIDFSISHGLAGVSTYISLCKYFDVIDDSVYVLLLQTINILLQLIHQYRFAR